MAGFAGEATITENMEVHTRRYGKAEIAYFTASCSLVYDECNAVAGVISQILETTGTVRARQELEDENSLLKRGLNHLPQMVWSTLADGYPEFHNSRWCEFTGFAQGRADWEMWRDVVHPDDRDRVWSAWQHSTRTGESFESEYRLKRHDGEHRWILGRALPERDESGEIIRWYGTCTDIHERVLAQEQIKTLQSKLVYVSRVSAMASMAATLAHEVNQPLTAAANYAAGLRTQLDSGASPETLQEGMAGVEKAVLRAGDIIRRLTKISKGQEPHREQVNITSLVNEAQNILKGKCPGAIFELNVEDGATAHCDPIQIHQVLTNLIRNACEATIGDEAARITITAKSDGERIRISVADNGAGIELGRVESVFDAIQPSTKGGMGVGLAISRTIVEAHGGIIKAHNLTPRGASFTFDLAAGCGI